MLRTAETSPLYQIIRIYISIPIYKHYKYIVNRFVQLANLLPSAVLVKIKSKEILCAVCFNKSCIYVFQKVHKISWILVLIKP